MTNWQESSEIDAGGDGAPTLPIGVEEGGDVAPTLPRMCKVPTVPGGEPCKIAQGVGCEARACALIITDLAPGQEEEGSVDDLRSYRC